MTISSTTRIAGPYTGTGLQVAYPFNFKVFQASDVLVTLTDTSGNIATQVLTSQYSVVLNANQNTSPGGTVNMVTAPPAGYTVVIGSQVPLLQPADLTNAGNFYPQVINDALDRLTILIQQAHFGNAISVPEITGLPLLPSAAARANLLMSFDASGNPIAVAPASGSSAALATSIANAGSPTQGAGQGGFGGDQNYIGKTIGARLLDVGASPRSFGATGDGVADDTAFITAALLYSKTLDLSNRSWKITSTITLPAGVIINMRGANIVAACGATPIFQFLNGNVGLYVHHGGGIVSGTASCFLFAQGKTNQPAGQSDFATQIHIESLMISSATITTALIFDKAVKSVYIHGVNFFTPNGISASGACVEVMISDSILFSATGVTGTYGIKLRSTGGTIYYNQGWSIVNSTIDNFEISNDITDCFVYTVTGGYTACNAALAATTGYAFQFQAPLNTSLTDTITIGGGAVIGGRVRFAASAAGQAYNANINATLSGVPNTAIAIENNAANITIAACKFKAGTNSPVGVVGTNNNANVVCEALDFDSTYTGGVILNGASGTGCSIRGITYAGSGDPFYVARPVLINDVPVQTANGAGFKRQFNPADLAGTYAVGVAISSQTITFAKGETGWIVASLPCSGMNAGTQRFDLAFPAGMTLPGGTGWGATFNYPSAASALVALRVPYYCTADGSGTLSITNAVGNTVTLNSHGYFGIERAF